MASGYINDGIQHIVATHGSISPMFWHGTTVPDGDGAPWASAPRGSVYVYMPSTGIPAWYFKVGTATADADWATMSYTVQRSGVPMGLLLALTHP